MVITEIEPIFMPTEDELMVNLNDSYDLIVNLLENLPNYFLNATRQDSAFVAALKAANNIIKVKGGKMVFF